MTQGFFYYISEWPGSPKRCSHAMENYKLKDVMDEVKALVGNIIVHETL